MPCDGRKKSPRSLSIVQITCFLKYVIIQGIPRNQTLMTCLDSFSIGILDFEYLDIISSYTIIVSQLGQLLKLTKIHFPIARFIGSQMRHTRRLKNIINYFRPKWKF